MAAAADVVELALLLTDVEGSTPAWEADPEAMAAALLLHDTVVAEVVAAAGGTLIKTKGEGDSTFSTFEDPTAAVVAAADVLVALRRAAFPLRVRAGVHLGPVLRRDGELLGQTPNRAARLRGLAQGGQIVCSAAVAEAVEGTLPAATTLVDLGEHHLRGIAAPQRAFGLSRPDLDPVAPLPPAGPGNLPAATDPFVGRVHDRAALTAALDAHRLVTLVGPGGVGKTRLAVDVADDLERPGGTWFLDVAALGAGDPLLAVARACRVEVGPGQVAGEVLAAAITEPALLVLDTCEVDLDRVADLATELLPLVAPLALLATSREPIRAAGEAVLRLAPLGLEVRDDGVPVPSEAAQLFLARMHSADVRSVDVRHVDADEAPADLAAIERIVTALDGVPLAIELAAAQVAERGLDGVAHALAGDPLADVTGGRRGGPRRQRSVEATIAWSHEALGLVERIVFRRLAPFPAGWASPDDAIAVIGPVPGADRDGVLASLVALEARSLVAERGGRSRLLDLVRAFAAAALRSAGEEGASVWRFADWAMDRADELSLDVATSTGEDHLAFLVELRAALAAAEAALAEGRDAPDGDGVKIAQRLVCAATSPLLALGALDELVAIADRALALGGTGETRAEVLAVRAWLAAAQGHAADARTLVAEATALVGERTGPAAANVLNAAVNVLGALGQQAEMLQAARAAVRATVGLDLPMRLAAMANLASALRGIAHHAERLAVLRDAAALAAERGSVSDDASVLYALTLVVAGLPASARRALHDDPPAQAYVRCRWHRARAEIARALGDPVEAEAAAREAAACAEEAGLVGEGAMALVALAMALGDQGLRYEAEAAAREAAATEPVDGWTALVELGLTWGDPAAARAALALLHPDGRPEADGAARWARVELAEGDLGALGDVEAARHRVADAGRHDLERLLLVAELPALESLDRSSEAEAVRRRLAELDERARDPEADAAIGS